MGIRYKLVNDSVSITEPVTLAEAKTQLRIDHADEDTYITSLITVARETAETLCNRVIASQTFTVTYDFIPDIIDIPNDPVQTIDTFTYYDSSNDPQTLVSDVGYKFLNEDFNPRIVPVYGSSWPSTYSGYEKVDIAYTAGWADTTVPEPIKHAILLIIASMHCDRKDVSLAPSGLHEVPYSAKALLGRYTKRVAP